VSFDATHAAYFFGRRQHSKIIADHVRARSVTVLYGASGVGKSSVLNVAVQTALGPNWTIARMRDWRDPVRLERAAVDDVLRGLPRKPRRASDRLRFAPLIAWATRTTNRPLLLILDQFEEYFLYRERERMRPFEVAMGNLLARRDLPLHILLAIRDDALHHLDELRAYVPGILDTTIKLDHLSDAGIEEAIRGPIKRYNADFRQNGPAIKIEDGLVRKLIDQLKEPQIRLGGRVALAGERQIELPYLQLAMTSIWEAEGGAAATALRESTLVTLLGGVSKIVRNHVNDAMKTLDVKEQLLCSKAFDRLITPIGGKIAYPTEALATTDVVGPNVSPDEVDFALGKLTSESLRILRRVSINGQRGFEIFHDVLGLPLLEWKRSIEAKAKEKVLRRRFMEMLAVASLLAIGSLLFLSVSAQNNREIVNVDNNTAWAVTNFRSFPNVAAISAIAATLSQKQVLWGKARVDPTGILANIVAAFPQNTVSSRLTLDKASGFFVPELKKFVFWNSTEGVEIVSFDGEPRSNISLNNLIGAHESSSRVSLENVAEGSGGTLLLRLSVEGAGSERQFVKVVRDGEVDSEDYDTNYFINMSKHAKDAQQGRHWRLYTDRRVVYLFDYHHSSLVAEAFSMGESGESKWSAGLGSIDYSDSQVSINSLASFPQGIMMVRIYNLIENRSVEGVKFLAGGLKDIIAFDPLRHEGKNEIWSLAKLIATSAGQVCLNKLPTDPEGCVFTFQDHESSGLLAIQVPKVQSKTGTRNIGQRAGDLANLVVIDVTTGKTSEVSWADVLNKAKDAALGPSGDPFANQITNYLSVGGTIHSLIVTVPNGRVVDVFSIQADVPSYVGTYSAADLNGVLYFSRDGSKMILINGHDAKIWDISRTAQQNAEFLGNNSKSSEGMSDLIQRACKIVGSKADLRGDWRTSGRQDDLPQIPCGE
jgi:hypothetical protein